jgi:hypothetical protein
VRGVSRALSGASNRRWLLLVPLAIAVLGYGAAVLYLKANETRRSSIIRTRTVAA